MKTHIQISDAPLDEAACIRQAADPQCGGMVVFIGAVRNTTAGRKVVRLEFECYRSMALLELEKIAEEMARVWDISRIVIHHRTGRLDIKDIAVIIVVNAMHRAAAFEACRFAIDTLKKTVPIWKKEIFEDGTQWVAAHP